MVSKRTKRLLPVVVLVVLAALYVYSLGSHAILLGYALVWPAVLLFGCGVLAVLARLIARFQEYRLADRHDS